MTHLGGDARLQGYMFQRDIERAVNEQVRQIFDDARHFESAKHAASKQAKRVGWIFAFDPIGEWITKSVKVEDYGIRGPRFETFGELPSWLFEQPEIPKE